MVFFSFNFNVLSQQAVLTTQSSVPLQRYTSTAQQAAVTELTVTFVPLINRAAPNWLSLPPLPPVVPDRI
jgi:hypothetical protein